MHVQVAAMLNGNPMGGKRRSAYHYDIWCLKYLSKFKWDHLTEEIGTPTLTPSLPACRLRFESRAVLNTSVALTLSLPSPHAGSSTTLVLLMR